MLVSVVSNGVLKAITQERLDITKNCAKVYAGGFLTGIAGNLMGCPAISRAGFFVGKPIRSVMLTTRLTSIMAPLSAIMASSNEIVINKKQVTSIAGCMAARGGIVAAMMLPSAIVAVPAVVGFGVIPWAIEKYNKLA